MTAAAVAAEVSRYAKLTHIHGPLAPASLSATIHSSQSANYIHESPTLTAQTSAHASGLPNCAEWKSRPDPLEDPQCTQHTLDCKGRLMSAGIMDMPSICLLLLPCSCRLPTPSNSIYIIMSDPPHPVSNVAMQDITFVPATHADTVCRDQSSAKVLRIYAVEESSASGIFGKMSVPHIKSVIKGWNKKSKKWKNAKLSERERERDSYRKKAYSNPTNPSEVDELHDLDAEILFSLLEPPQDDHESEDFAFGGNFDFDNP